MTPEGAAELRAALERARAERASAAELPELERAGRVAELDARAALLDATLATLTVLGPEAAPEGEVAFATWVTVDDPAGRRTTWRIVGPDEADPRRGLLGAGSPVARALLRRRVGDAVEVERPGGTAELTVVEVRRSAPGAR